MFRPPPCEPWCVHLQHAALSLVCCPQQPTQSRFLRSLIRFPDHPCRSDVMVAKPPRRGIAHSPAADRRRLQPTMSLKMGISPPRMHSPQVRFSPRSRREWQQPQQASRKQLQPPSCKARLQVLGITEERCDRDEERERWRMAAQEAAPLVGRRDCSPEAEHQPSSDKAPAPAFLEPEQSRPESSQQPAQPAQQEQPTQPAAADEEVEYVEIVHKRHRSPVRRSHGLQ